MSKYDNYRLKFKNIFDESSQSVIEDTKLKEWGEYLSREIPSENSFKLYYYAYFIRNKCKKGNDDLEITCCTKYTEVDRLYLSSQNNMNDIFEGIGYAADFSLCDNELKDGGFKNLTHYIVEQSEYAYIKSFSEDPNNALMWSHYANHYTGICVEYDFSKIETDSFLWEHLFPVVYCNERQVFCDLGQIKESFDKKNLCGIYDTRGAFSQKSQVWGYEKEWRFVFTKSDIDNLNDIVVGKNNIKIDFPYVTAVYIGPGLMPKYNELIKRLKKDIRQPNSYDVYLMEISGDASYELKKHKIDTIKNK